MISACVRVSRPTCAGGCTCVRAFVCGRACTAHRVVNPSIFELRREALSEYKHISTVVISRPQLFCIFTVKVGFVVKGTSYLFKYTILVLSVWLVGSTCRMPDMSS